MALPTETFFHPNRQEEQKEEKQEEKKEEQQELKQEEQQQQQQEEENPAAPQMNLLATVFKLRRDLHRAEEQRTRVRRSKRGEVEERRRR